MWIALIGTAIALAIAMSVAAVLMESYGEKTHP
jgi:hypothetical protein